MSKPKPNNPALWSRAKAAARNKFKVYPSAYANAWAAKWYKSKGGTHKMPNGHLHSGKTHGKTSKRLYHFKDLSATAKKRARG